MIQRGTVERKFGARLQLAYSALHLEVVKREGNLPL